MNRPMELHSESFHSPSSGLEFPGDGMYIMPTDPEQSNSPMSNIDEDDDLMPSASRSLEGVTLTSQSLTSVQCQSIDSYTSSTVPSQRDTNVTNSDSLESASTDQSNTQSIDIEQVDTTVRSESHHVIQPMPLIYGNPPVAHQQPNLIFLQQPSSVPPVVHCGGIQLTQQDLHQIQQQLQQKLLNQPVTATAPVQVHIPPQQYVILGSLNPNVQQFYVPDTAQTQGFGQLGNTPAIVPVLQPMTSVNTSTTSQTEITSEAAITAQETIPSKPTSKLTKAPVKSSPHFPVAEEMVDLEELERFSKHFKRRRVELGFTQGDVGAAIGKSFPNDFSQTTISRFEALNLSYKNMCKIKPYLQRWLDDRENKALVSNTFAGRVSPEPLPAGCRRRKKRTTIEDNIRDVLEICFQANPKPNTEDLTRIANEHNIERDVVRVWFCNRRQREKRVQTVTTRLDNQTAYPVIISAGNISEQISLTASMQEQSESQHNTRATVDTNSISVITSQEAAVNSSAHVAISAAMMSQQGAALRNYAPTIVFHNT